MCGSGSAGSGAQARAAAQVDVRDEQTLAAQLDALRDADEPHVPALCTSRFACIIDSCVPSALEHRIRNDAVCPAIIPATPSSARAVMKPVTPTSSVSCCRWSFVVSSQRDDAVRPNPLGGQHTEQAERPVAGDHNLRSGLNLAESAVNHPEDHPRTLQARDFTDLSHLDPATGLRPRTCAIQPCLPSLRTG